MTVQRKEFWLKAEPNWALFGQEGGLPNPGFNAFVCCYCSLEDRGTYAVSVSSDALGEMFGDAFEPAEDWAPDVSSWCGYEWAEDGSSWELECGPEAGHHWWEIDDLLWGAFEESVLWAVNKESHSVKPELQMVSEIGGMSFLRPEAVAASAVAAWHGG